MKINFIKTNNLITISPEETLSSALSKLHSSHDAGFILSDDNKYLGVINPYHCLINNSYPGNAKVSHCLFHAPRLKPNFPISKVAQLMIESKIHYLPIFDDKDNLLGVYSARHLVNSLMDRDFIKMKIGDVLKDKKQQLITVFEDDFISTAINLFKKHRISKLIVVNREMKLKGILSHFDLISFLITPRDKENQGERTGDKKSFFHQLVRNFSKPLVLTLTVNDYLNQALKMIIEKKIGSVIIVDQARHPIGLITTRDFLNLLTKKKNGQKIEVVGKNLSQENRQILGGFFKPLTFWIGKIPGLSKAKLFVKEEKQGNLFQVVLSLIPKKGQPKVIKREGNNLLKVLKKIKKD